MVIRRFLLYISYRVLLHLNNQAWLNLVPCPASRVSPYLSPANNKATGLSWLLRFSIHSYAQIVLARITRFILKEKMLSGGVQLLAIRGLC